MRAPPRYALHQHSPATATTLTAYRVPARLEGKPGREPAERARRENRTPGGDGPRSLGQVYYLRFIRSGAQTWRPVAAAPGSGERKDAARRQR
jgi:hypothetical protein